MQFISQAKSNWQTTIPSFALFTLVLALHIISILPCVSSAQTVKGKILNKDGTSVGKAEVALYKANDYCQMYGDCKFPDGAVEITHSSRSGEYQFKLFTPGSYAIIGRKGNLWFFRNNISSNPLSGLTINDTLQETGSLHFPVNQEGQSIHDIKVHLYGTPFTTTANNKGSVELKEIPAGSYFALIKSNNKKYSTIQCSLRIRAGMSDIYTDTLKLSYSTSVIFQNTASEIYSNEISISAVQSKRTKSAEEHIASVKPQRTVVNQFRVKIQSNATVVSPLQKLHLTGAIDPDTTAIESREWSINHSPFYKCSTEDTTILVPVKAEAVTCILRCKSVDGVVSSDTLTISIQSSKLTVNASCDTIAGIFEKKKLSAQTKGNSPIVSLCWDIGNTGNFISTPNGQLSAGPFRFPQKKVDCIIRAIDATGERAFDTISIKVACLWDRISPSQEFTEQKSQVLVTFNNSLWSIGGSSSDVRCSNDGKKWVLKASTAPFGPRYGHASIAFDGKLWVIGGKIGQDSLPGDIWNSVDGVTWQRTAQLPFLQRYYHSATIFQNQILIIGGINDSATNPCLNDVWISKDGINWSTTDASTGFEPRYGHGAVVFGSYIFLLGGLHEDFEGSKTLHDVWRSADGQSWNKVNQYLEFPDQCFLSCFSYDRRIWAIGGYLKNSSSVFSNIMYSEDGVTWTKNMDENRKSEGSHISGTIFNDRIWMSPSGSKDLFVLR